MLQIKPPSSRAFLLLSRIKIS